MNMLGLTEKKHAFVWGFCLATVTTIVSSILILLSVAVFAGGPQTGRDHALPASLFMLLIAIGLTQWIWLIPLLILSFRNGRQKFGWGILANGIMITLLNFPFVWKIFANKS